MGSINLIIYDFDGVMTDNKVYVDQSGNETVQVNRADGLGVAEIKKLGLQQLIVSTETNPVVSVRARKLDLPCLQGVKYKSHLIAEYCSKKRISMSKVAYVGNDINDMEAMKIVGTTFCPADAHEKIKRISQHVLSKKGGDGVVREILDFIQDRYNSK
jgi:3-deoxy-D-manno-octulosonate 8-phosphate phosphatase (KDO 8-P phosphatase)